MMERVLEDVERDDAADGAWVVMLRPLYLGRVSSSLVDPNLPFHIFFNVDDGDERGAGLCSTSEALGLRLRFGELAALPPLEGKVGLSSG